MSAVARRLGIRVATVSDWRHRAPGPDAVRAFADTYGLRRVEAFVAAGLLDPSDIAGIPAPLGADTLSNRQLLDEVERRMTAAETPAVPALTLAADTSSDSGVDEWRASTERGEEPQDAP